MSTVCIGACHPQSVLLGDPGAHQLRSLCNTLRHGELVPAIGWLAELLTRWKRAPLPARATFVHMVLDMLHDVLRSVIVARLPFGAFCAKSG